MIQRTLILAAVIACVPVMNVFTAALPTSQPEAEGLSSERLERLEEKMQAYVDNGELAGVVTLIVRNGSVVHHEAYGYSDIEQNTDMQPDSLFRIFSMTKPITSVALLALYEEGHFQLNDPVADYIPEFKTMTYATLPGETDQVEVRDVPNPMTIQDVLTHTSGYSYDFPAWMDEEINQRYADADLMNNDQTLAEMVKKIAALPAIYAPGTAWEYGLSTDICGRLVEVISGMSLGDFMQDRIFDPLGMDDTAYVVNQEERDRMTTVYMTRNGDLVPSDDTSLYEAVSYQGRTLEPGGHGLVSTAMDYARFAQMLLNGGELNGERILSRKTVELMTANHLRDEVRTTPWYQSEGYGFGLGVSVVVDQPMNSTLESPGTFGWSGYANTTFFVDPVENMVGVLMAQHIPNNRVDEWDMFTSLTYQAITD